MRTWQQRLWKWTAGLFAAAVIVLATGAGLFRLFAPLVPGYRTTVETWASRVLGRPVSIVAMGARWDWYGPEITLEQVRILSHDRQRVVTEAREIRLGISLRALLHGEVSRPSRIELIQPQLVAERDRAGVFSIRGLSGGAGGENTDWRRLADETFAQRAAVIIRHGELTFHDARMPTPLLFKDIDLDLDNSADSHRLSGSVILPAGLGRSLSFDVRVEGEGLKPEAWRWQAGVQGAGLDLPRMLAYWPAYDGRFTSGLLDLRAQLDGQGAQLRSLSVSMNAHDVFLPGLGSPANGFNTLTGSVDWTRSDDGWRLSGDNLRLQRGADAWPVSHFSLQYARDPAGGGLWSGDANFLRLQDLVTLASWLPADFSGTTARLLRLSPQGDVTDAAFAIRLRGKSPGAWQARGRFTDLGVQADGHIPGFTGLDGRLQLDQDGGLLTLATRDGTLSFPHLFRGPLYATTLSADVQFQHDTRGWRIATDDLAVVNADARARAKGSLLFPADGSSPVISVDASVADADVRNKSAYFPVGIMPQPVVAWLDSSIAGGQVPSGSLALHGKLKDFPFDHGGGVFDIRFHLLNGSLDYAVGWPQVQNLDAEVEFKGAGMQVAVRGGTVLGDDIGGVTARFADLSTGVLEIDGTARGGAQATLDFLRSGPLKGRFGQYLDKLQAGGRSDVTLHLVLPVQQPQRFALRGAAALANASVAVAGQPQWRLSRLNGAVTFTADGVAAKNLRGMLLGEPVSINLHPGSGAAAGVTLFTAAGAADATALTAALRLPDPEILNGRTAWQIDGRISNNPVRRHTGLSLSLSSNLQGLGVNLPAPFGKPAGAAVRLAAGLTPGGNANSMILQADYMDRAAAVLVFDTRGGNWEFRNGDVHLGPGSPPPPAASGLSISGAMQELSLDDWRHFVTGASHGPLLPPLLHSVDLEIGRFAGLGQHIERLHAQLTRAAQGWQLDLASTAVSGRITLPPAPDAAHPIIAAMDMVTVTPHPADKRPRPGAQLDPKDVPALRFSSRQLRYGDMLLDAVRAELVPQADGVALRDLSVGDTAYTLSGSGQWTSQAGGKQNSTLAVQLHSRDVAKTLQAFGYQAGITGDQGELQANLNWQGGPFGEILKTLNGTMHLKLQHGQLLEVKPGVGRIFGLLSINALPQRLLLNFSDVFGKGFAYDSIEGDFTLSQGNAYTSDMTVAGPAAKIHVIGRTGLVSHDFDEALIVDTSVGSTLPVVGALAAGVGVGAVVWLLTEVFKKPISAAGEVRYHLTGTWDNPVLENVTQHKQAATPPH